MSRTGQKKVVSKPIQGGGRVPGKMSHQFVALAAAAVGVIYTAGYMVTASPSPAAHPANRTALLGASATSTPSKSPAGTVATSTPTEKSSFTKSDTKKSQSASGIGSVNAGHSAPSASSSTGKSSIETVSKPVTPTQKWLDGTYRGSGSNVIGTVSVAVAIKGGKITDVQITQCDTHYPEAYIDPVLPDAVIKEQIANAGYVSGATFSSLNFMNAVSQALSLAKNPKYRG